MDSESASGSEEPLIDELNGCMTAPRKAEGEDGEVLKLEAEGEQVEIGAVDGEGMVESGGEDGSLVENEVQKSKIPVMVFLMGVWAMLKRGYERLLETDWLSWLPFWRQEKRLERLIAEADANPKDAAKQTSLLIELNKHRSGIGFLLCLPLMFDFTISTSCSIHWFRHWSFGSNCSLNRKRFGFQNFNGLLHWSLLVRFIMWMPTEGNHGDDKPEKILSRPSEIRVSVKNVLMQYV